MKGTKFWISHIWRKMLRDRVQNIKAAVGIYECSSESIEY